MDDMGTMAREISPEKKKTALIVGVVAGICVIASGVAVALMSEYGWMSHTQTFGVVVFGTAFTLGFVVWWGEIAWEEKNATIRSLHAENDRLRNDLATTEGRMRDRGAELSRKHLQLRKDFTWFIDIARDIYEEKDIRKAAFVARDTALIRALDLVGHNIGSMSEDGSTFDVAEFESMLKGIGPLIDSALEHERAPTISGLIQDFPPEYQAVFIRVKLTMALDRRRDAPPS